MRLLLCSPLKVHLCFAIAGTLCTGCHRKEILSLRRYLLQHALRNRIWELSIEITCQKSLMIGTKAGTLKTRPLGTMTVSVTVDHLLLLDLFHWAIYHIFRSVCRDSTYLLLQSPTTRKEPHTYRRRTYYLSFSGCRQPDSVTVFLN